MPLNSYKIKNIPFKIGFLIFIGFLTACFDDNDIEKGEKVIAKGDRLLGIEVNAAQNEDYDFAFNKASEAKIDFNHISLHWTDFEKFSGELYDSSKILEIINDYYPKKSIKVLLTILSPINTTIRDLPEGLSDKKFDDTLVIKKFNAFLDFILPKIEHIDLLGLIIGNEVNIYLSGHPEEAESFNNFFLAVSNHSKTLRKGLKVSTTITFYGIVNNDLNGFTRKINENTDFVSLTYYPLFEDFTVRNADEVKTDFKTVCDIFLKDIYFQECGYPTSAECNSSEEMQSKFVTEVFKSWDLYPSKIKAISFFCFTDWNEQQLENYLNEIKFPVPLKMREYIRTLGFRTLEGREKQAFQTIINLTKERNW